MQAVQHCSKFHATFPCSGSNVLDGVDGNLCKKTDEPHAGNILDGVGGLAGVRADGCEGASSVAIKESGLLTGAKAGLGN